MTLEDLGYTIDLENYRKSESLDSFGVGRVISEHKEMYVVKTAENEYEAEIIGNLRFSASDRSDFPAVGDWVAISEYGEDKVLIHSIFPRQTIIARQAVGKHSEKQIIATNIDYAFIVQAVDRDYNINRLERYLSICYSGKVEPIIILNKIDLIKSSDLEKMTSSIQQRIKKVDLVPISNSSQEGIEKLRNSIEKGKTYCLLGSSGVGKSTLLNNLSGKEQMKTNTISESTNRGRHVTSHRELLVLESGGIIIDNPGIREVGIADAESGIENTFEKIIELSQNCKFADCSHIMEVGCSVLSAVESGELDKLSFENYLKIEREKNFFESSLEEKRKKDKDFGRMIKNHKKHRKSNKY